MVSWQLKKVYIRNLGSGHALLYTGCFKMFNIEIFFLAGIMRPVCEKFLPVEVLKATCHLFVNMESRD